MTTFGERLKHIRGSSSQAEFAALFGIPQVTLGNYERNRNEPRFELVQRICTDFGINAEWLLFGTGSPSNSEQTKPAFCQAVPAASQDAPTPHDIVWIPLVDALLPAGHDSLKPCRPRQGEPQQGSPTKLEHGHLAYAQRLAQPVAQPVAQRLAQPVAQPAGTQRVHLADPQPDQRAHAFRRDFITHKGDPEHMVLLRASGDSMAPEILHNDTVLIDQSLRTLSPGCIFAVAFEQAVYVKRLDYLPGKLVLSSANPAYPPVELSASGQSAEHFRILGRVLWVGRDLA